MKVRDGNALHLHLQPSDSCLTVHRLQYQIGIRGGHKLITDGPYALMIHPGYTGLTMNMLGTAAFFVPSGYWFWLVSMIVSLALLGKRVRMEEQMLTDEFGATFTQRTKTVARFVPGLF